MTRESLNPAQIGELKLLATSSAKEGKAPVAQLMRLSQDWGIDYAEIAREYTSISLALKAGQPQRTLAPRASMSGPVPRLPVPGTTAADSVALTVTPAPEASVSPVAGIRAEPGSIYVQGYNWPLIEARLRSGLAPAEIARLLNPPMAQADYKRVEEGRMLPSADHIAQICTLLEVKADETFIMAGPDPNPRGRSVGYIKGASVLGVLRVRRRLTFKAMAQDIEAETQVAVPSSFLSQIENGKYTVKGEPTPMERVWINAIAAYLEIPVEWVLRKVPPELLQKATQNIRHLHVSMAQAVKALPPVDLDHPHLLLTSGGDTPNE